MHTLSRTGLLSQEKVLVCNGTLQLNFPLPSARDAAASGSGPWHPPHPPSLRASLPGPRQATLPTPLLSLFAATLLSLSIATLPCLSQLQSRLRHCTIAHAGCNYSSPQLGTTSSMCAMKVPRDARLQALLRLGSCLHSRHVRKACTEL